MKTDHWDRAEELFNAALSMPHEERAPFLQRECNGEEGLLSEVQSLLSSFDSHSDFLENPVFELGLEAMNDAPPEDRSGTTIGSYQLEERIGVGGMGEVYKAIDTRLNRRVALKFLTGSLANNRDAKRQLMKEAQAVAMLDHPNICAVHSIEQTDDSQFIVMQFIEGQTLGDRIVGDPISPDEFRSIARQIISAVAFAHSLGVIHRDLKPGNIMLTPDGTIKVLDFGLAKIIPQKSLLGTASTDDVSQFSQAGSIIGTVSYMSPEQLRGEKLDYRSDVFSVGVVLHEILSGKNPFKHDSQAETIAAVLASEPPSLDLAPGFCGGHANIVEKCLAKKRDDRFQSAAEILVEMDNAEHRSNGSPRRKFRRVAAAVLAALVLAAVVFAAVFFKPSSPPRTLAVLPISFDPGLASKEYLAEGLTHGLIEKLATVSDLKVKNEYFVSRYKGADPRTAGRDLSVDAVVSGSIIDRNGSLALSTNLIRVSDGKLMESDERPIDEANLIELQEGLATLIVSRVKLGLSEDDLIRIARKDTEVPEAKLLFIKGRHLFERQESPDLQEAIRLFKQATELDPLYAKAWTGLADAYALIGVPGHDGAMPADEAFRLARFAATRAMEIDDTLAEPHVSLATIKMRYDWDWDEAEAEFRKAIRLNPDLPPAYLGLSNLLIVERRFAESAEQAKRAKLYLPLAPLPDLYLARAHMLARNWIEVDSALDQGLKQFPDHRRLTYMKGLRSLYTGRLPEAQQTFEKIYDQDRLYAAGPLALTYGRMNRRQDVLRMLRVLEEESKKKYVPAQEWAWVYLALDDRDTAFDYLDKACRERFAPFPGSLLDPAMDELSDDPRFAALKKCANISD